MTGIARVEVVGEENYFNVECADLETGDRVHCLQLGKMQARLAATKVLSVMDSRERAQLIDELNRLNRQLLQSERIMSEEEIEDEEDSRPQGDGSPVEPPYG